MTLLSIEEYQIHGKRLCIKVYDCIATVCFENWPGQLLYKLRYCGFVKIINYFKIE